MEEKSKYSKCIDSAIDREKLLLSLMVQWDMGRASGMEISPSDLCPEDSSIQEELQKRIEKQKLLLCDSEFFQELAEIADILPEIPGYSLLHEINRGGMGVVYAAKDTHLNRDVAIKMLLPRYSSQSQSSKRFVEEAKIAAQLQHPGIAPVHKLGTTPEGRPFLAMKLIKGHTLSEMLAKDKPPFAELQSIFEQICRTVAYAHNKGVIHRDLKPANVMVGAFGEVQVMDWGLAKLLGVPTTTAITELASELTTPKSVVEVDRTPDSATKTGSILGTPAYMPPEQANGEMNQVDTRSDVFALGAILCQLITGQPPYTGKPEQVRAKAIVGDLKPARESLLASGVDAEWVQLAIRCLSFHPDERPNDAGIVEQEVVRYRNELEVRLKNAEQERNKAEVQVVEQRKRRKVLFGSSIAVVTVLLVGLAASLWQADRAKLAEMQATNKGEENARLAVEERKAKDLADTEKENAIAARIKERQNLDMAIETLIARSKANGRSLDKLSLHELNFLQSSLVNYERQKSTYESNQYNILKQELIYKISLIHKSIENDVLANQLITSVKKTIESHLQESSSDVASVTLLADVYKTLGIWATVHSNASINHRERELGLRLQLENSHGRDAQWLEKTANCLDFLRAEYFDKQIKDDKQDEYLEMSIALREELYRVSPENIENTLQYAKAILESAGDSYNGPEFTQKVNQLYEKAVSKYPNRAEILTNWAEACETLANDAPKDEGLPLLKKSFELRLEVIKKSNVADENYWDDLLITMNSYNKLLVELEKTNTAKQNLRKTIKLLETQKDILEDSVYYNYLGSIHLDAIKIGGPKADVKKYFQDSIKAFRAGIGENELILNIPSDFTNCYIEYGRFLIQKEKSLQEGIDVFKSGMKLFQSIKINNINRLSIEMQKSILNNELRHYLYMAGKKTESLDCARIAVELSPNTILYRYYYAWHLNDAKQYNSAIEQCKFAISLQSNYPDSHSLLGDILIAQNKIDEGLASLEKAAALDAKRFSEKYVNAKAKYKK